MNWHERIRTAAEQAGHWLDSDVVEELAAHAQTAYEASRARGDSAGEADAHVARLIALWIVEAGALKRVPRRAPAIAPPPPARRVWSGLGKDARYGVRILARQRGFAVFAILTIALAIGVTTTLFSVID